MEKSKILIVAPYGMTLRQLILNDVLWANLVENYEIHVKSPLEISNFQELGIGRAFEYRSSKTVKRVLNGFFFRLLDLFKTSTLIDFLVDNNLGEHLVFRLKNSAKIESIFFKYLLMHVLRPIKSFTYGALRYLAVTLSSVSKSDYKFLVITHIAEANSELEALAANRLNVPVITITLGMDNYRHGRLIYKPDLMLLWGKEHEYEFKNWHQGKYESMKAVRYEIVGNLVHDTYLRNTDYGIVDRLIKGKKNAEYDGYILVPAMIEAVIPGQTKLIKGLIDYLKERELNLLVIVRALPGTDIEMWLEFENENHKSVLIQEPLGGSYDKRGLINSFKLENELHEVKLFSELISKAKLVVNLYPTTVTLDAYLFETPSILPLFDWRDADCQCEHPYGKILLSKMFTHPLNSQYNIALDWTALFRSLDEILLHGKVNNFSGVDLYEYVCGQSKDGNVGLRSYVAIENYLSLI